MCCETFKSCNESIFKRVKVTTGASSVVVNVLSQVTNIFSYICTLFSIKWSIISVINLFISVINLFISATSWEVNQLLQSGDLKYKHEWRNRYFAFPIFQFRSHLAANNLFRWSNLYSINEEIGISHFPYPIQITPRCEYFPQVI